MNQATYLGAKPCEPDTLTSRIEFLNGCVGELAKEIDDLTRRLSPLVDHSASPVQACTPDVVPVPSPQRAAAVEALNDQCRRIKAIVSNVAETNRALRV